jgi:predicted DNA-binding protein (MmcQ/YjbR family)
MSADDVRRLVAELPETEERETWGHPTFRVRDKMFAGMAEDGSRMSAAGARVRRC